MNCCTNDCRQGRDCPLHAAHADPIESSMVRWVAAFLVVVMLATSADRWVPILLEWVL